MNDLKFNIYAFSAPTTKAEYSALLDEALRLMDELGEQITCLEQAMDERASAVA